MKPSRLLISIIFTLVLIASLAIAIHPAQAAGTARPIPAFKSFIDSIKDGQANTVRGVYAPDLFALKVVQQPASDPSFVSPWQGMVTEFKAAHDAGNIGLLAHNYMAGQDFPALKPGQEVRVIFGDGKIEYFKVTRMFRYQALQPKSTVSDFLDLDSGEKLAWTKVFKNVYQGAHHLTFQTCIYKDGEQAWGRLFVIAEPFVP